MMHIPSDDEIAKFFNDIKPEDFAAKPAKPDTATSTGDELYERQGADEFERFKFEHLSELTDSDDDRSFIVLHSGGTWKRYEPNKSEQLPKFLARVSRDVKKVGAKWIFIGMPGEATMGKVFDPTKPHEVEQARADGRMMEVVNWYAESIEPGHENVSFGIILTQDGEKQVVQSTYEMGANPAFRKVLRRGKR
jgi:hypothetical protein